MMRSNAFMSPSVLRLFFNPAAAADKFTSEEKYAVSQGLSHLLSFEKHYHLF